METWSLSWRKSIFSEKETVAERASNVLWTLLAILQLKWVTKIEKIYQELKKQNEHLDEEEDDIEWVRAGITVRIKPH